MLPLAAGIDVGCGCISDLLFIGRLLSTRIPILDPMVRKNFIFSNLCSMTS